MKTQNLTKNPKLRNRHLKLRFRVYLMVIIGKENIHRGPSGAAYIHKYVSFEERQCRLEFLKPQ